jgi:hypothetical protein
MKREFDTLPINTSPEEVFSTASLAKAFLDSMGLEYHESECWHLLITPNIPQSALTPDLTDPRLERWPKILLLILLLNLCLTGPKEPPIGEQDRAFERVWRPANQGNQISRHGTISRSLSSAAHFIVPCVIQIR